jgi:hypothetical protein
MTDFRIHLSGNRWIHSTGGNKFWHLNGELHRTDGPAVEWADGDKEWYLNGERHQTDGPAVEYADEGKEWFLNDKLHRTDGPAIECADGYKEWWEYGAEVDPPCQMIPNTTELVADVSTRL